MMTEKYHSRNRLQLSNETAKSNFFYLNQLRSEIKLYVINNNQWKDCGVQLSLFLGEGESSLLQKIFESKNHFLLLSVYDLIFRDGHSYRDVHSLLQQALMELNLLDVFKPWIEDAGVMMVTALNEHNRYYGSVR